MKKTLMKSLLLAAFALGTQNVSAQKVAVDDAVATNIVSGMSKGEQFYFDAILYEVKNDGGEPYTVKAVAFYAESTLPESIDIIGSGNSDGINFTVDEIEALNSVKKGSMGAYQASSADMGAIAVINFVNEDGNGFSGTIGEEAFGEGLTGLEAIVSDLTTPPTADDTAFDNLDLESIELTVPTSNMGTIAGRYGTADGWKWFYNIFSKGADFQFANVNMDSKVDVNDVKALRIAYQEDEYDDDELYNPQSLDIDGNGKFDVNDVKALRLLIQER